MTTATDTAPASATPYDPPTDDVRDADFRLVREMTDAMRGNTGKIFYVCTETKVTTFEIPRDFYERERRAAIPVWLAREKAQNVVGFGVAKQYM